MFSFISHTQTNTKLMNFDGFFFRLPMTNKKARKLFKLNKFGKNGHINDCKYKTLESDDGIVVGITFYKRLYKESANGGYGRLEPSVHTPEKYITDLEAEYKSTFKPFDKGTFGKDNVATYLKPQYGYIEIDNEGFIVVGSEYFNLTYNSYTTVSFYNGITIEELYKNYK